MRWDFVCIAYTSAVDQHVDFPLFLLDGFGDLGAALLGRDITLKTG